LNRYQIHTKNNSKIVSEIQQNKSKKSLFMADCGETSPRPSPRARLGRRPKNRRAGRQSIARLGQNWPIQPPTDRDRPSPLVTIRRPPAGFAGIKGSFGQQPLENPRYFPFHVSHLPALMAAGSCGPRPAFAGDGEDERRLAQGRQRPSLLYSLPPSSLAPKP
jgi:hypothetical protein